MIFLSCKKFFNLFIYFSSLETSIDLFAIEQLNDQMWLKFANFVSKHVLVATV